MYKKSIIVFVVFLMFTDVAYAASVTIPYYGTTSESSQFLWADSSYGDDDFTQINYVSNSNNAEIRYYSNSEGSASLIGSDTLSNGSGTVVPPGGTNAIKLYSGDGGEVYLTYAASTNPANTDIYFETPDDSGGNDSGGSDSGNCGCIFNTPGWQDYMGKVDDIIAAIPPPPNWGEVANTFRDSIVPNLVSEVEDMLGYAPSLPSPPANHGQLDDGGIQKPTGQEASGLGNASFDANDIKNGADTIQEKEDPTGGFDILNPIDSLPTQDEFKENIPDEGDMIAPEVPDVEGVAPTPPEVEGTAPEPVEEENIAPSAPTEQENIAPTPPEVEGTAPNPSEGDNMAPGAPTEQENVAPTPGDTTSTAPVPGEGENIAPTPNDDLNTAPIPGADNSTAPVPGNTSESYPMPGE